jgi:hypothetical protein
MHVKQLPRWASKKGPRQHGRHLMVMRRLLGPTSYEAKLERALPNKGNPPPKGLYYLLMNNGGEARGQQLIVHIVEARLCRSKE